MQLATEARVRVGTGGGWGAWGPKRRTAMERQCREEMSASPALLPPTEEKETELRSAECL